MDLTNYIKNNSLTIIVRPNSPKTEIRDWDKARQVLKVNVSAPPEKDKANKEVIKFFSKLLKKRVKIAAGGSSRKKLLKISPL